MQSSSENSSNKIGSMNLTLKIKLISRKEKNNKQNIKENKIPLKNNISFLVNGTNEMTHIKQGKNEKEVAINSTQNEIVENIIGKQDKKGIYISSNNLQSTCITKASTFDEYLLTNSNTLCSQNTNNIKINISSNSLSDINIFPEVEYCPVPEREYYDDILQELLFEEKNIMIYKECFYIKYQQNLDNKIRAKLIGFLYKMSKFFRFKNRTLFLSVQTMDKFFCKEKIDNYYFLLMCMCALVVSSKFNEIYYPAYKDIIQIFGKDYKYTVKQALQMETLILKTIDYNLFPVFPMCFFDIIAQKTNLSDTEYYLGNLMMELIQYDFSLYPIKNSILAQTAFGKVVNLTRGKNYDSISVLKSIFPEEDFQANSNNIIMMKNASIIINDLLHNLNSEYFVDIYENYRRPEILGDSINYFLNE